MRYIFARNIFGAILLLLKVARQRSSKKDRPGLGRENFISNCKNSNEQHVYVLSPQLRGERASRNCTGKRRSRHAKIGTCKIDNSGLKTSHNSSAPNISIDELPLTRQ
jgi:hypothetical protein